MPDRRKANGGKLCRLRPTLAEAWRALGAVATQRGDWNALEPIGDQLRKIAPTAAEGYLFHATARFNKGDADSAEADLKYVVELAPQSALGYVHLGQLRAAQKRWSESETMYRQALTKELGSLEAVQGLVDLDFRRDRPADAVHLLQAQLEHTPENASLYFLLGEAQLKSGQPGEAERALARAADIDKQNANVLILLASVQASRGETDLAIGSYQRAVELAPRDVRVQVALGSLFELRGNWQQAQRWYEKALSLQPDEALAANNLAYLMLEHGGNVNVALTLAQTARRGLPDLANSADTLAWAYFHNGAFSVAAPLLKDAVKKAPGNPTYRYHLGLTYQKLDEFAHARTQFEKAIGIDPKSPIADEARRALSQIAGI
jgi:tetratricopeptide (TPR) repeat protein